MLEANPYQAPQTDITLDSEEQLDRSCPLCGQQKKGRNRYTIYDHSVCKKCCHGFANRRQLAFVADSVAWQITNTAVITVVVIYLEQLQWMLSGAAEDLAGFGLYYILLPLLFAGKDCFSGYSPGKLICGVRVIDKYSGQPAGIRKSLMRNLPLVIPFVPLFVAFQLIRGHRLGDGWSRSKVIWRKYADHPIFAAENHGPVMAMPVSQS